MDINNNPYIESPDQPNVIYFAQTRDSLLDADTYIRFVHNCENNFRRSEFYRGYKAFVMNHGLRMDQNMPGITSEMASIELHHHLPTLKQATIMITEHLLNTNGCCTTFEVVQLLEEAHRNHWIGIVMLSTTNHQVHESNPADFISVNQCFGYPAEFITRYMDGMTLDISFKILLQLKQEIQNNYNSYTPMLVKARDQILSWQYYNGIYTQQNMFVA